MEAGAASHGIPLAASLPAPHDAGAPRNKGIAALSFEGWARLGGLPATTVYVRAPGLDERKIQRPLREAPFPVGLGMGVVGLGMVLSITMVRRYRLNIT